MATASRSLHSRSLHSRSVRRWFVPDLSPEGKPDLGWKKIRHVFVAESPHVSEVTPEREEDRRPLCGAAGREWWALLGDLLEGDASDECALDHVGRLCVAHGIAVLNAVQFPLDPKIARHFPEADPLETLGFSKVAGESSFKKLKTGKAVQASLLSLRTRLEHPAIAGLPVHPLGNDSEWLIGQALGKGLAAERLARKIPHPSAWWRQDGLFRRQARERLSRLFEGSSASGLARGEAGQAELTLGKRG